MKSLFKIDEKIGNALMFITGLAIMACVVAIVFTHIHLVTYDTYESCQCTEPGKEYCVE